MATIKSYTDIEQSRKLAEILPIESADMCYIQDLLAWAKYGEYKPYIGDLIPAYGQGKIRCWSLAALLKLMPTDDKKDEYYVVTESHSDYHIVSYRNCWDGLVHSEYSKESLLDAAFEMVVWLKENKKL